jgi:hypothetical protein
VTRPTPTRIAAMLDALHHPPADLVPGLVAMLEAEARCGSAAPDGWPTSLGAAGGRGRGGLPARPTEAAVAARDAAPGDEHTALTRAAVDHLRAVVARVELLAHLAGEPSRPASRTDIPAMVARIASAPRKLPEGTETADMVLKALTQACERLSRAVDCVRRSRQLAGPRRDPERCETPGCDGSAARDAGGRGGRCRRCVDWRTHHGHWPDAAIIDALARGDRTVARVLAQRART